MVPPRARIDAPAEIDASLFRALKPSGLLAVMAAGPLRAEIEGDPLEPVSAHIARFRREWTRVLREIASACPLVAESCEALLGLDPLSKESDAAIKRHVAEIRPVLSDPGLARRLYRERDRSSFGSCVAGFRKERGWTRRRLVRECQRAAQRIGLGVHAPDRFQLMDYESGRSNAHPRTKVVLAAALRVAVDQVGG